jgi:hypothetical protein
MKKEHSFLNSSFTRKLCCSWFGIALLAACLPSSSTFAQAITPVWEYLINKLPAPLPILTNSTPVPADLEIGDGHWPMDTLAALKRYDANRLLLGIRENGIDENDPSLTPAQLALSTNYPDRSLIWINPTNGAPMGVALKIGLYPVALDQDFIDASIANGATDYTNQYWWSFDVSSDGYVYTGYKNKIIRYAPNGSGGISPTPQVVFTLDTNTVATVHGNLYTTAGRFPKIRVRGTGVNTVLLVGGNSGTRGYLRLSTSDGTHFVAGAWMVGGFGAGGSAASSLIPSQDPANPTDEWVYSSSYPGNSSGIDSSFIRMITTSPFVDPDNNFTSDSTFTPQVDSGSNSVKYSAHFIGDIDANANLNYVVAYSTPSWNSIGIGSAQQPGWLALHNMTNGDLIASYQISVTEADELLSSDEAALFQGTIGYVTIDTLPNGSTEILWSSPVYGYGRYLVSDNAKYFTLDKNINAIWEILDGPTNALWPIINSHVDTNGPVHNDNTATMTMLTGLKRYDANRLLLGIRDNGINETVAHNTNLANQFPDRSLQWVDARTGAPLGTALVVNYTALGYSDITPNKLQNMAFGVDAAGVVYVGVADKIIRYAPASNHTNFLAPTVAFNASTSSHPTYSADMLFANFRISGSGTNTVMFVGNKDWYGPDGEWYLTTSDGLTFALSDPGFMQYGPGGGNSSIVPDPATPGDNLLYDTKYPSTSNGVDSNMSRRRQPGGTGPFFNDAWTPEQLPGSSITNSSDLVYRTFFLTDVQTLPGLDYVVAYSTPSYNTYLTTYPIDPNIYNGGDGTVSNALRGSSSTMPNYQPGWLAVHDATSGDVRGLRLLNVTEALTLIPGFPFPAPHADTIMGNFQDEIPQGGIEMYPFVNGGAEVLWWSTTYGIGRYTIDAPPSATAPVLTLRTVPGGMMRVDWTGLGSLQTATDVLGPYTTIPNSVSGYTFIPGTDKQFFRVVVQ